MKNSFLQVFSFFFGLYGRRTSIVVLLLLFAGFAEAIGVASFLPLLQIILEGHGGALPNGAISDLLLRIGITPSFPAVACIIVCAMLAKAAFLWSALRYVSKTVTRVAADLRTRFLKALLHADWKYFATHTLGSSLNAVAVETFQASTAFVSATRFLAACIQFCVYAAGAMLVSWVVFAGGAIIGGLIVGALWALVRAARRAGALQTETSKTLLIQMADMLQGIKPLRVMALEDKFFSMMKTQSRNLEAAQAEQLVSTQSMRIFNEPLMMIAGVAGLFLAVTYADLQSSSLILMGILFMRMLTGMNGAQGEYQRLVSQESALWSLIEAIEKAEKARQNWPGKNPVPENANIIVFKNVSFYHRPDKILLRNANIEFPARGFTAIVGGSGSGKTSILDLICGLYRPVEGRIEVSGTALETLDIVSWRQLMGFVPQEVYLFNDSIIENIRMGRSYTEEDVQKAIIDSGAKEFIDKLPHAINSPVGENGRLLSGGQRQRIAIARALIGHPRFLLLDEATSALDSVTEDNILKTLRALSQSISVICVSHNPAILKYADVVYEMDTVTGHKEYAQ